MFYKTQYEQFNSIKIHLLIPFYDTDDDFEKKVLIVG